jgi:hypothetical protein|tara:strand:+ start:1724 stop:2911 length:1188 start_codon:yes stop_codon:yes gene_type:complete
MATNVGLDIVEEELIFGFDSGYGVADNATSTRFYPGEPTVNYVTDSPSEGGWSGTSTVLDSSAKSFRLNITNFAANPGAGWRAYTWDMTSHAGDDVTISATFEYVGPVGAFAWLMIGQVNSHTNSSGAGGYLGYAAASEKTTKTTTTKERVSWSGTLGSPGTANSPTGHVGITVWINDGIPGGTDSYVVVSNVQIEKKDHATPFVNGTRAATASLIDLKRTNDIDISNISFNSTGQPTLDGSDDEIDITFPTLSSDFGSIEVVVARKDTTTNSFIFGAVGGSTNRYYVRHAGTTSYDACRGNPLANASFGVMTQDKLYHLVMTWDLNTVYAYTNGVFSASSSYTNPGTDITGGNIGKGSGNHVMADLPVFKVYGKTLSATEIKQNYNAYKKRFDL